MRPHTDYFIRSSHTYRWEVGLRWGLQLQILRLCKIVYKEAIQVLYSENVFLFQAYLTKKPSTSRDYLDCPEYDYTRLTEMRLIEYQVYSSWQRCDLMSFIERLNTTQCHLNSLHLYIPTFEGCGTWCIKFARALAPVRVSSQIEFTLFHSALLSGGSTETINMIKGIAEGRDWTYRYNGVENIEDEGDKAVHYHTKWVVEPKRWWASTLVEVD